MKITKKDIQKFKTDLSNNSSPCPKPKRGIPKPNQIKNWDHKFVRLMTKLSHAQSISVRKGTVVIEVYRGCASVRSAPKGIKVVIRDLD